MNNGYLMLHKSSTKVQFRERRKDGGGERKRKMQEVHTKKVQKEERCVAAALLVKNRNKNQKPRLPDFLAFSRISTTVWVVSRAA